VRKTTFVILCLEGAILSFNVAACAALIPSISVDFKVAPFITGRIIWIYMLAYGIAALAYGPLVRVFDAKNIKLICFLIFSLANLWVGLSQNITSLFMARFLMGVFGASVIPLVLILIANQVESHKRGRRIGIFFSATFLASLSGLFLSGILNWRLIFLIPAIAGFILWINMYFYLPNFSCQSRMPQNAGKSEEKIQLNYLAILKDKRAVSIFTYIFLISIFYHGTQQWLSVYFSTKLNLGQFLISMLITLTSLSGILGEVIGGFLSDIIGRIKIVNSGTILMMISIFLLIFRMPPIILAIIMFFWGLGWTFNHAGISTMVTELPKKFLNESASLNSSIRFTSGGLGVVIGGWLMQKSFTLGFLVFGFCLLGLLFFSVLLEA
jgi:predicted MFS family arabinose efflux permease